MPWLQGGWAGFVQHGNQGCRTCSLHLPNGLLEKIRKLEKWNQTLATGTLQQVNFALKMLQNQMGNRRSHWMLLPGNTQNFIGHSPEKFHLLFKSAVLWSGGWPRWPPNLNYSIILKSEKINARFTAWLIQQTTACYPMLCDCVPRPSDNSHNINNIKSSLPMVQAAQAFSYRCVKSINPKGNGTEGQQWHFSVCKQSCQIPDSVFLHEKPENT